MPEFIPYAVIPNVLKPLSSEGIYERYKEMIPLEKRMYLQTLFGDRNKEFTAADLTDKELDVIGETIKAARNTRKEDLKDRATSKVASSSKEFSRDKSQLEKGSGNVQYNDYLRASIDAAINGREDDAKYYPIWNSLGRFNYTSLPNKDVSVKDTYDFYNEQRAKNVQKYEQMNPLTKVFAMIPFAAQSINELNLRPLASAVGEAYIGRNGRPVNIVIPKDAANLGI